MSGNPIPENLRSEHLFLLVGSNPLPDWVAARLLLRKQGRLYLVHSDHTLPTAQRLAKYLQDKYDYVQPVYVGVQNAYHASEVEAAIKKHLGEIKQGTVGLNYTGGTKVMAAHAHRTMDKLVAGLPPVIFSYLEARSCTIRFDHLADAFPVGLADEAKLDLVNLFVLHDEYELLTKPSQKADAFPAAEQLIKAHVTLAGQRTWRTFCERELKYPRGRPTGRLGKNGGDIKADADARRVTLAPGASLSAVAEALISGGGAATKTLDDVMKNGGWDFKDAEELAKWLDGGWLEHYVLQQVADRKTTYKLNDYGRNFVVGLARFDKISRKGRLLEKYNFEIDVMALRGYQLHVISCYTGSERKAMCKQKLFEAFTRAQQLGGDQGRAALVCCSDDPLTVEREVAQDWDLKDQVKVFGRKDLLTLGAEFQKWFDVGA